MTKSASANPTMTKFGYPDTRVAEYDRWVVLLRPRQVTLGALVLVCKSPARAFHEIGREAFAELERVTTDIERALGRVVAYEKLNYLMLMMVDPDVHFHVIPRHSGTRRLGSLEVADAGWPGPPDLKSGVEVDATMRAALLRTLAEAWPSA
jgi:diadenosine tetraphosphate (Ap4A) HIT family hydrolase